MDYSGSKGATAATGSLWRRIARRLEQDGVAGFWYILRQGLRRWRPLVRWISTPFELAWVKAESSRPPDHLVPVGNYWIDPTRARPEEPVYSFGVGADIGFDLAIVEIYGCQAWLYDPTPKSASVMENYADRPELHFEPLAVWIHDGSIDLYYTESKTGNIKTGSVTNLYHSDHSLRVDCCTVASLMARNGHDRIGILKMDIEGAAIDVLEDCLGRGIHPRQILVEFEKDGRQTVGLALHLRLYRLIQRLRALGYRAYFFPREKAPTDQFEFAFVREAASDDAWSPESSPAT